MKKFLIFILVLLFSPLIVLLLLLSVPLAFFFLIFKLTELYLDYRIERIELENYLKRKKEKKENSQNPLVSMAINKLKF